MTTSDPCLRMATAADLPALVKLASAFREHLQQPSPSAEEFRASFSRLLRDDGAEFLLAEERRSGALGYVQVRYRYSAWTTGVDAELEDVFVIESARARGVGRALVELALARAAARGCRQVGVATNERNAAALALYGALGFRAERARWNGGRQLWLEKALVPG